MNHLRLLQHRGADGTRSVILAEGEAAHLLQGVSSIRELALRAISAGRSLADEARSCGTGAAVDIAAELEAGLLLAPIDHEDAAHLLMTGTGLIRGLTDPLTTLNGRNIFTAAGTSFALQDISANLVKQVDVYKTRSANQIETGRVR